MIIFILLLRTLKCIINRPRSNCGNSNNCVFRNSIKEKTTNIENIGNIYLCFYYAISSLVLLRN